MLSWAAAGNLTWRRWVMGHRTWRGFCVYSHGGCSHPATRPFARWLNPQPLGRAHQTPRAQWNWLLTQLRHTTHPHSFNSQHIPTHTLYLNKEVRMTSRYQVFTLFFKLYQQSIMKWKSSKNIYRVDVWHLTREDFIDESLCCWKDLLWEFTDEVLSKLLQLIPLQPRERLTDWGTQFHLAWLQDIVGLPSEMGKMKYRLDKTNFKHFY